jgi:nickel/cobalt exporter
MPDLFHAIQSGATNLWIFIPTAILLGALHGLEPGHSKTMMAAFIIAIRGTIAQAVLLGLCAAVSHSLLIALLAAGALHLGSTWNAVNIEPYLQLGSAVCILGLALWMFLRTRRDLHEAHHHHHHHHGEGHGHHHHHDDEPEWRVVQAGPRTMELTVFEIGVPPVFRVRAAAGEAKLVPEEVKVETVRAWDVRQAFALEAKGEFLQSVEEIPEPHEFELIVTLGHDGDSHSARTEFREDEHGHEHGGEFQDAHELEHAEDIRRRFAGRAVTTPQIMVFGITGGLMPCPAAFSVLLICLQLKRVALGFTLVGAFSFGLALTMVSTGALAAWSVHHAQKRFRGFGELMRRAPYLSCVVLVIVALYMAWHGWSGLATRG